MNKENIEETIFSAVLERMEPDTNIRITNKSHLVKDLNIDSMEIVELLFDAEDKFDVSFEDEPARDIETVGDVINYIFAELSKRELAEA